MMPPDLSAASGALLTDSTKFVPDAGDGGESCSDKRLS